MQTRGNMNIQHHELSIRIEKVNTHVFLYIKTVGKLTHDDYQQINPMVNKALKGVSDPKLDVFFDASELKGWEIRALWDDFKFGLEHEKEFEKIAILGNKKWQEYGAKVGSWFVAGDIKYFESSDDAMQWLKKRDD
jgi:hypothetical protein